MVLNVAVKVNWYVNCFRKDDFALKKIELKATTTTEKNEGNHTKV